MRQSTPKSGFFREMSCWCLCVVVAMAAQMRLLFLWSSLGPSNGLSKIMDPVYAVPAHGIGTLFFEEPMSLGNIPLGLAWLFLMVMLYSVVIGTVFCVGYKLFVKRAAGKTAAEE